MKMSYKAIQAIESLPGYEFARDYDELLFSGCWAACSAVFGGFQIALNLRYRKLGSLSNLI